MERRDFVKTSAWAAAATGPFLGNVLGANDRIVVGQIGCGGRGQYELSVCQRNPKVHIAAVCDVYRPLIDNAISKFAPKADGYQDFRKVLERKDIDAVFVSTGDHWHAIPTIMACQAGKDVYCEKPLSHTLVEGCKMVEAARKYDRVVQTGSQQRSAPHFRKVAELIQSGYIGKVTVVECWNAFNEQPNGIGNPPDEDPPDGLDWDLYLGPAPKLPYNRNRFIWNFRWFWDYGNGWMTDWGAHHIDVVHWAMGVDAPKTAVASGGKFVLQDNRETPDTLMATFEYPGFVSRYWHRGVNGLQFQDRWYGMIFYGTLGTLIADRSGYEVVPELRRGGVFRPGIDRIAGVLKRYPPGSRRPKRPETAEAGAEPAVPETLCEPIKVDGISMEPSIQEAHVQNFFDCVRSRQRPVADVEIGHRSASACHLGVISYKTGRKIRWDAERETILDDAEAQALTTKEYRAPWNLKV